MYIMCASRVIQYTYNFIIFFVSARYLGQFVDIRYAFPQLLCEPWTIIHNLPSNPNPLQKQQLAHLSFAHRPEIHWLHEAKRKENQ